MNLDLFKARDVLVYVLWRRANILRSIILRGEILQELNELGIVVPPITQEEIEESKDRVRKMGIDLDSLRKPPQDDLQS